ncbi:PROTEIN putative-RELATED [Salix viminalis]|uniref:PROTEIN putative-RELATED n=1 Tax=Salix viminalis TaxID=40686 RepID=A0A9Q0ZJA6_SALVM|nr:PROTEIN putative-RELATED [Salix viminalis]
MITRSNLVDQLREYQIRSKHDWASVSFFSSTSNLSSSRVDVVLFVIWELFIIAFLVFSAVSLYFRHMQLAFILIDTISDLCIEPSPPAVLQWLIVYPKQVDQGMLLANVKSKDSDTAQIKLVRGEIPQAVAVPNLQGP